MNDPLYQKLLEASWQRPLNSEEEAELQAYLAAHPEAQAEWEEDILLTQQLRQLPAAPLSSNFTALVLQTVKAEAGKPRRAATSFGWLAWVRHYLPRAASAGLALVLVITGSYQYRASRRAQLAKSVAALLPVTPLNPEMLQDFDAIVQLSQAPTVADEDLLGALE